MTHQQIQEELRTLAESLRAEELPEIEALEKDFVNTMQELQGDQSLDKFRQEYERLHRAMKASHEAERQLIAKGKQLAEQIINSTTKVQLTLQLHYEDNETIEILKRDVDKAWNMAKAANEQEQASKQTIQALRVELQKLNQIVDQDVDRSKTQEHTIQELQQSKETLERERDLLSQKIQDLKSNNIVLISEMQKLEGEKLALDTEQKNLRDQVAQNKNEFEREDRKMKRLEGELELAKKKRQEAEIEVENKKSIIKKTEDNIQNLKNQIETQELEKQKIYQEDKQQKAYNEQQEANIEGKDEGRNLLNEDISQIKEEIAKLGDESVQLKSEKAKIEKENYFLNKKNNQLEAQKEDADKQKENFLTNIHRMSKNADALKRQVKEERKMLQTLSFEKESLIGAIQYIQKETKENQDAIQMKVQDANKKRQEIQRFKEASINLAKRIWNLEKDKEKFGKEASQANEKYHKSLEEVKLKKNIIAELQKKKAEADQKLKQQQNLYEAVRSDRNLYSKNLIENQDEIAELKREFKILTHNIDQLKEEISAKTVALKDQIFQRQKVERNNERTKNEKEQFEAKIKILQHRTKQCTTQIQKLRFIISEAEKERLDQKQKYENVINDRDFLGTQLIRRNDELALLYEKIKIQQETLAKGQLAYRERQEDNKLLNFAKIDLKRMIELKTKQVDLIPVFQKEIRYLNLNLLDERKKVKALSEELENPLNNHRYRLLEGQDPDPDEMIQKIQALQRRLISKTEQLIEKNVIITEKEKLYGELNNILARQPGSELAEQLTTTQQLLKDKTRKMKSLAAELNMYQAQVNESKIEINRLSSQLTEIKRIYFKQKKEEQQKAQQQ